MSTLISRLWRISAVQLLVFGAAMVGAYLLAVTNLVSTYRQGFEAMIRTTVLPSLTQAVRSPLYLYTISPSAIERYRAIQRLGTNVQVALTRFAAFQCTLAVYDAQGDDRLFTLTTSSPLTIPVIETWDFSALTGDYLITRVIDAEPLGVLWVKITLPHYISGTYRTAGLVSVGFLFWMTLIVGINARAVHWYITRPLRAVIAHLRTSEGMTFPATSDDELHELVQAFRQAHEHLSASQRQLAGMSLQYMTILKHVSDGIAVFWQQRLLYTNPTFSTMLRREIAATMSVRDLFGDDMAAHLGRLEVQLWQHQELVFEWDYAPERIGRVTCVQIAWGAYPAVMLTVTDITAERQRAQQITHDTERFRLSATAVFGDDLTGLPLKDALERTERFLVEQALTTHGGDVQQAAAALGVSDRTVYRKLNEYKTT